MIYLHGNNSAPERFITLICHVAYNEIYTLCTLCITKRPLEALSFQKLSFSYRFLLKQLLYNSLLSINCYTGNSTTKCHSRSMSNNRDLTETFHQKISSYFKVIASAF